MNIENLLFFVPLAIGISWLFYLIFRANLATQPLGRIISYFLGVVIIALTVGWLIDNVLPLWFNERIQNTRTSVEWQQFVGTSSALIDSSFTGDEATQPLVAQPTPPPLIQVPQQNPSNGGNLADPRSSSNTPQDNGNLLSPTTHIVVAGDTLLGLARQYDVTLEALRQANNLYTDLIYVGQELIIPARPSQK